MTLRTRVQFPFSACWNYYIRYHHALVTVIPALPPRPHHMHAQPPPEVQRLKESTARTHMVRKLLRSSRSINCSYINSLWKPLCYYRSDSIEVLLAYQQKYVLLRKRFIFPFSACWNSSIRYHRALVTVRPTLSTRRQHAHAQPPPEGHWLKGSTAGTYMGRKLMRSSWSINCSSVLRTFVDNQGKPLWYHCGISIEVFLGY